MLLKTPIRPEQKMVPPVLIKISYPVRIDTIDTPEYERFNNSGNNRFQLCHALPDRRRSR